MDEEWEAMKMEARLEQEEENEYWRKKNEERKRILKVGKKIVKEGIFKNE